MGRDTSYYTMLLKAPSNLTLKTPLVTLDNLFQCLTTPYYSQLSEADKELIIVATSAVNRCPYCVIAHGALHRIYSKQPMLADQVTVNWKLADLSDRELAMLEFALAVCQADNITEEHFQKLERHGFDREDAWDIGMISAFFAVSNHIAHFIEPAPKQGILYYGQGATWGEGEGGS